MPKNMDSKVAVVTGATGGIGKIIIKQLKALGVKCISIDMQGTPSSDFLLCDMTKQADIKRVIVKISSKYKSIDLLFNLSGIGIYKNIEDLSVKEWNNSIAINLTAPYILTKGLLPLLKKSDNPIVVSFGSGMGVSPTAGRIAYCSSKFGLRGLSLTLSKEFKDKKVKFVHLTLGSIMTNFGSGGMELRKKLASEGKNYLNPNEVVRKVIDITKTQNPKPEYEIYPEGYMTGN